MIIIRCENLAITLKFIQLFRETFSITTLNAESFSFSEIDNLYYVVVSDWKTVAVYGENDPILEEFIQDLPEPLTEAHVFIHADELPQYNAALVYLYDNFLKNIGRDHAGNLFVRYDSNDAIEVNLVVTYDSVEFVEDPDEGEGDGVDMVSVDITDYALSYVPVTGSSSVNVDDAIKGTILLDIHTATQVSVNLTVAGVEQVANVWVPGLNSLQQFITDKIIGTKNKVDLIRI